MRALTKIIAVCGAAVMTGALVCPAQNLKISKTGEVTMQDGSMAYVIPSTTLIVDITVRHEKVVTGEYARFAQRYLGVIAPLADKELYEVESASIGWIDNETSLQRNAEPAGGTFEIISHIEPGAGFMRVLPDRLSSSQKNAEDAARDAANMIYNIRKRRVDLIMGDIGENVYGEGLKAALERMDKIENDYMELFLGKQSEETYTVRFYITPERDRNTYVVCRINEVKGILPTGDLSGEPVMLELKPEGLAAAAYPPLSADQARKNSRNQPASGASYAVADMVVAKITDGRKDYVTERVPVYQMGVRTSL